MPRHLCVNKTIFDKLVLLNIVKSEGGFCEDGKSLTKSYMDLVVEKIPLPMSFDDVSYCALSLAHYYEQNGDLCQDPEMVVLVNLDEKKAHSFSFQQALPPHYSVVYPELGLCDEKRKSELDEFLSQWLSNLIVQGHGQQWEKFA